ncbi:MAG: AMP-binding protein, partial [Pseudomonadota bacterium]
MAGAAHRDFNTFDQFLAYWADERPHGIALEDGERRTTYGEVELLTRRLITALQARGIGAGDRFAWLGKNSDRYFMLLYAAARMGAVMAPIGWRLAPREIGYIL